MGVKSPTLGGYLGDAVPGFAVDYSGARFRNAFDTKLPTQVGHLVLQGLPVDKELYEWRDLICAIEAARLAGQKTFVFAEFGAGYGRWGTRAYLLARRAGIRKARLILVEAEPQHLRWLHQSLRDNRIPRRAANIVGAAISGAQGRSLFYVDKPDSAGDGKPNHWYGQALVHDWEQVAAEGFPSGLIGRFRRAVDPSVTLKSGWTAVAVRTRRLRDVVPRGVTVDLADFDVQGIELEVLEESIDVVNTTFRMVHIATHSAEVEAGLRDLMNANGWILVRDVPLGWHGVESGKQLHLVDGVQTWINPRLILRSPEHFRIPD